MGYSGICIPFNPVFRALRLSRVVTIVYTQYEVFQTHKLQTTYRLLAKLDQLYKNMKITFFFFVCII